jgi:hypothetical protein
MIVAGVAVLSLVGGTGGALAASGQGKAGPGHGNNTFGLCNAFMHNADQAKKAPPFMAVAAEIANDANFCTNATATNPGGR